MNNATKTGVDAPKTASKRVVQKTAGATGDLIGNKIADIVTSVANTKNKKEEDEINERKEITYHQKKEQIIDDLRCFYTI